MKKFILGIALAGASLAVWASCTTSTTSFNGKFITCTTCCDSRGNCNTTCF
jgi:hypothetical protein